MSPVELRAGEVHLWRGSIDISSSRASELAQSLSHDELGRVERFRSQRDVAWYVGRRAWLRLLLSRYLAAAPASLAVEIAEHGKPRLADVAQQWLHFNISDSGSVVVGAVARDREVGVDVERIRADVDVEAVSRRFLTARQHRELGQLDPAKLRAAFFTMWTANEAYLKGIGTGLDGGDHDLDGTPGWTVATFDAGVGYAAAVAVEGAATGLRLEPARLSL